MSCRVGALQISIIITKKKNKQQKQHLQAMARMLMQATKVPEKFWKENKDRLLIWIYKREIEKNIT